MLITSAINLKVGMITGMIIGGVIAVTAKQMVENRSCMSKCSKKSSDADEHIKDKDEHSKD
jgi:ethanolamine transporter EutH